MKRLFYFVVFIFIFLTIPMAFANQKVLRGTWSYTIDGRGVPADLSPVDSELSVHESGTLVIKSKDVPEGEQLEKYSMSGRGTATAEQGSVTTERRYSREIKDEDLPDVIVKYQDPWILALESEEYDDEGSPNKIRFEFEIRQVNENKITGAGDLFDLDEDEDDDERIMSIKLNATRVQDGGGCNTGFNPFLALALLPLFFKVKK